MKTAWLFLLYVLSCSALAAEANTLSRLISPQQLQQLQQEGTPSLRILDVRTADEYSLGHVPGAANLDAWQTFNTETNYLLPPVARLQQLLRSKGVNNDDLVVVYDQGGNYFAARIVWMLDVLGHEHTRLMDGGLQRWSHAGMPVTNEDEPPVSGGNFVPQLQPRYLASKFIARLAMDNPNLVLLDVRPQAEYLGTSNPNQNPRSGHIPGALNLPWTHNLVREKTTGPLKIRGKLKNLYQKFLPENKRIVTYCQAGGHSAMTYFILRELGYDVAVYDGAWHEWSRDPDLPVEPSEPES